MLIHLPVADVSVSLWLILSLGGGVGLISGLFGVGGGFLLTPLLIMSGIAPAVAVATQAPQIVASAFSGVLAYGARSLVDYRMGWLLLSSGLIGSWIGVKIFERLQEVGQVEFVVTALYVALLGLVGAFMTRESLRALRKPKPAGGEQARPVPAIFAALPWKMRFPHSGLTISVIPPLAIGFFIGVLGAIMGVGGGFIMVPAMIYLLGLPTTLAIGTSLFQITLLMAGTTVFHASETGAVDALLAFTLLAGGVVGAQVGAMLGRRLRAAELRLLLALLVLGVGVVLALNLVRAPEERFSVERAMGGPSLNPPATVETPAPSGPLSLEAPAETPIDLWFAGAEVTVVGRLAAPGGAAPEATALTLRLVGETETVVVREKARRFGVWLNADERSLEAPAFYGEALSAAARAPGADATIAPTAPAALIGAADGPAPGETSEADDAPFRAALIRLRQAEGLYAPEPAPLMLRREGDALVFEARFALPPSATAGAYRAEALLLDQSGAVAARAQTPVLVRKVGLEGMIATAASQSPLLYSLLTLLAAIAAGWLAHTAFGYIRHLVDLDEEDDEDETPADRSKAV